MIDGDVGIKYGVPLIIRQEFTCPARVNPLEKPGTAPYLNAKGRSKIIHKDGRFNRLIDLLK
jgi:hypothetical protein